MVNKNKSDKSEKYKIKVVDNVETYGFGYRHVQVVLVCVFISMAFIIRVNMSVAIVAMTDKTQNSSTIEIFHWNKKTQDLILSSFFWGYTLMQIPAGYLAERFGAKPIFTVAIMVNGVVSLITPLAVHWGGWMAMCACRALQGITQSGIFPGTMALASRWIPNQERSRLTNIMFSGVTLGTVAGMPLSSLLASTSYGWPSMFYVVGSASIVIGILWICFSASTPVSHKSISEEEKMFIEVNTHFDSSEKKKKVPWKGVLTSLPFYSLQVAQIGSVWIFNTIFVEMPSYMNKILGINVRESGLYSALPFMAMWAFSMVVSVLSDWLINNKICSILNTRRIFNCGGTFLPAIMIIIMTFIPAGHPLIAILFLILTVGFMACINVGFMLTYIDIAPNFSGTILGMTNFVSQALGIFAPVVVGFVVKDETDPSQWQIVFFITSALVTICNLFYITFTSADVQPWNNVGSDKDNVDIEMKVKKSNESPEELKQMINNSNNKD